MGTENESDLSGGVNQELPGEAEGEGNERQHQGGFPPADGGDQGG